jgi:type II secretory pathway pseudopilin PulG
MEWKMQMKSRRGFTSVELMVVIGIILLLIAMLFPVVVRARREAGMVRCASDEKQYLMAALAYAQDNKDYLPRFDGAAGAGNPHDVTKAFYRMLVHYGLPHRSFFCPFTDQQIIDVPWNSGNFVQTGYAWWVPRSNGGLFPPNPPSANVVGTQLIHGPVNISDPLGKTNPVITDDIYLYPPVVPNAATFDVSQAPAADFYQGTGDSSHLYHGVLDALNEAYIDGHVERVPPTEVHCVYLSGNAWVCR